MFIFEIHWERLTWNWISSHYDWWSSLDLTVLITLAFKMGTWEVLFFTLLPGGNISTSQTTAIMANRHSLSTITIRNSLLTQTSGPVIVQEYDTPSQELEKSQSDEIWCKHVGIILKCNRRFGNRAVDTFVKLQRDRTTLILISAAARFGN